MPDASGGLDAPANKFKVMLKQRIATAAILAVCVIAAVVYFPTVFFSLACAAVLGVAAWEWAICAGLNATLYKTLYVLTVMLAILACLNYRDAPSIVLIIYLGLSWWGFAFLMVVRYQAGKAMQCSSTVLKALAGMIILLPAWLSVTLLHAQSKGVVLVLFLFVFVWLIDMAAFFSGRILGRRKLAGNVSPGKSWEGVGGAFVVSLLPSLALVLYLEMEFIGAVLFVMLMLVTVGFSVLGDLVESLFKRMAGLKDSGKILPGHGGILDRIDSLVAAAPVFFVGLGCLGIIA